jgi:protocatechuate 3,4-dioxygenase beta subunit
VALRPRRPLLPLRRGDRVGELPPRRAGERRRRQARVRTIFPAAYSGRWPHIHFEVYEDLAAATAASSKLRTSQIALPKDVCDLVFATSGYEQSVENLGGTSLESDMVFSDGYASQLAKASGDVERGITLSLNVGV